MNLEDLDGDDGENDENDINRREDGGDENIASQEDIFVNIDINFSLLAWIFMLCTYLSLLTFFLKDIKVKYRTLLCTCLLKLFILLADMDGYVLNY